MAVSTDGQVARVEWGGQQANGEVLLSAAWEVFILSLSILSVSNLAFVLIVRNPDIDMVFLIMDSILTVVFLLDFLRRLSFAPRPGDYFARGYGWVDLMAAFPLLRIFRIFRVVRVLRILGRFGGPVAAFKAFFANRATGGLLSVALVAILVLEFGALLILIAERGAEGANIESAKDAIWYLLVTMSTVGYGDYYPVTDAGRLIGSFIIVVGVGVFGTLTGFLANAFLSPSSVPAASEAAADGVTVASDGASGSATESDPGQGTP